MKTEPETKYKLPPGFAKLQLLISDELMEAINSAAKKDMRTQRAFVTKLLQEHSSVREFIPKVACVANEKAVVPTAAPVVAKPRPAPAPWVNPAVKGSPCEHMYSPPAPAPDEPSYDCPPTETMEEYQEKLRKGEIKLDIN